MMDINEALDVLRMSVDGNGWSMRCRNLAVESGDIFVAGERARTLVITETTGATALATGLTTRATALVTRVTAGPSAPLTGLKRLPTTSQSPSDD